MSDESRRHLRFQIKKGAFAAFFPADKNECVMLGEIVDISEGGFGICYIDIEKRYPELLQTSIYGLENAGFVDKMPCKIVYKMVVPANARGVLNVRRCGIQFKELSKHHIEQLKQFIQNIGTGTSEVLT